jgi:hypothetical protein
MEINELKLPVTFVQDIHEGKFQRVIGSWQLKENVNAFGNHLETELGGVYKDPKSITQETKLLPKHFAPELFVEPSEWQNQPGFIPDILDFSKIVCFGMSGDGAPFCFDFREDENNPSVIWWDDAWWVRIAPNYESFIGLFDFSKAK